MHFRSYGLRIRSQINVQKSHFRGCFQRQDTKRPQALLKSASQTLYHIFQSLPWKLSWKKFLLLTCQILGLFVTTLTTDENYPVLNRENLMIPIQMVLSQKQKAFSQFLAAFLKSRLNFEYFEKKHDPHRFCFSKLSDS